MARRPSYSYERTQRDRAKVAKREAKRDARAARKGGEASGQATPPDAGPTVPSAATPATEPRDASAGGQPTA